MQNTENKFKHDGFWYIAVDGDGCRNCEFQSGWPNKCVLVPNCVSGQRQDNRNVIFVRSDVDNLGDEK